MIYDVFLKIDDGGRCMAHVLKLPGCFVRAESCDDALASIFERLRQLANEELAVVAYPQCWTQHPDEPWTARKALRRLLEHGREHIRHIEAILAA